KLEGPSGAASWVGFTPDGTTLVTVWGKAVVLFDVASGRETRRIDVPLGDADKKNPLLAAMSPPPVVDLSPDGATIATGGVDGFVRLWATATGREKRSVSVAKGGVLAIAFVEGGKKVLALAGGRDQGSVRVVDVASGETKDLSTTGRGLVALP